MDPVATVARPFTVQVVCAATVTTLVHSKGMAFRTPFMTSAKLPAPWEVTLTVELVEDPTMLPCPLIDQLKLMVPVFGFGVQVYMRPLVFGQTKADPLIAQEVPVTVIVPVMTAP